MVKGKILIADDEDRMRKLVKDFLVRDEYTVIEAGDGEEALKLFYSNKDISLVILDIMMPKMDGIEVLKEIRMISDTPVLLLTAKGEERDELLGFNAGADEYITKPFSPKILVARVNAILKRSGELDKNSILTVNNITVDKIAHRVLVDGVDVDLSVKEFELLSFFIENKGVALSREKILDSVWNYDYFGDARTIDTHVKKLRNKLGDAGECIKTIWGMGYKLE